jgi:hypothetical protein
VMLREAVSTMDLDLMTRVIGPRVREALAPYEFARPPLVRVNGFLPVRDHRMAAVEFEVRGESFRYWGLEAETMEGKLWWEGERLEIAEVEAALYGGRLHLEGLFDFSAETGAGMRFRSEMRGIDLHRLGRELLRRDLEGKVDATLVMREGNTSDPASWQGAGLVSVREGYLWEVPVFGFLSPVLNSVAPGLGNTRFGSAQGVFEFGGGRVWTENLELRSMPVTLLYAGSVDFEGNLQARVQAEILRQTWGLGTVLNWILKPITKAFEYEVTGTLGAPVFEPVYLPRFTLQPFRAMRELLNGPPLERDEVPGERRGPGGR